MSFFKQIFTFFIKIHQILENIWKSLKSFENSQKLLKTEKIRRNWLKSLEHFLTNLANLLKNTREILFIRGKVVENSGTFLNILEKWLKLWKLLYNFGALTAWPIMCSIAGLSPKNLEAKKTVANIQFTIGAFHLRNSIFLRIIVGRQNNTTATRVIHWNLSSRFWAIRSEPYTRTDAPNKNSAALNTPPILWVNPAISIALSSIAQTVKKTKSGI